MSKLVAYKNTDRLCFCQIQFDSREKVLVSFASAPEQSVKIIKLLFGFIPFKVVWEYKVTAGEDDGYGKMLAMLSDNRDEKVTHPLDAIIMKMIPFSSCFEAINALRQAEERASRKS